MNEEIDIRDFDELSIEEANKRISDVLFFLAGTLPQLKSEDVRKLKELADHFNLAR